jgi:very-short-patch-repair endonuclease
VPPSGRRGISANQNRSVVTKSPRPPFSKGEVPVRYPLFQRGRFLSDIPFFKGGDLIEWRYPFIAWYGHSMLPYERNLKPLSQALRSSMTDAELVLWAKLRRKQLFGFQFYRQKPIGRFIVDFYCPKAQLVIEVDGGQHYTTEGEAQDSIRDAYLHNIGLLILRFSNTDVLQNIEGVIGKIVRYLEATSDK